MKTDGHRKVAAEAGIPRLKEALKAFGISEDSYPSGLDAFYLGNWLTDCSQFKDPHGFIHEKPEILADFLKAVGDMIALKLRGAIFQIIESLPDIKNDVKPRLKDNISNLIDKYLTAYRGKTNSLKTLLVNNIDNFIESLTRFSAYKKFVHPLPGQTEKRISFSIFEEIFKKRYTQYFPHEHLDRPPCKFTLEEYCNRNELEQYKSSPPDKLYANKVDKDLGIYSYLKGSLQVAIGTLYEIDKTWASKYLKAEPLSLNTNDPGWHLGLADLGYALHALEDFFAHSTFIENVANMLGQDYITDRVYDKKLLKEALKKAPQGKSLSEAELLKVRSSDDAVRKIYKRLKKYVPDVDQNFDQKNQIKDDEDISTGYFDGEDTLIAILQFILEQFKQEDEENKNIILEFLEEVLEDIFKYEISIYGEITNQSELGKLDQTNEVFKKYLQELRGEKIKNLKGKIGENYKITDKKITADVLIIASTVFDIIIELSQVVLIMIYVILRVIKVGGFVLQVAEKLAVKDITKIIINKAKDIVKKELPLFVMKRGLEYSGKEQLSDEYYDLYELLFDKLGANRIGSHSLLAKDSSGEPLYNEMFLCAKTVHWYVVDAICRWSNEAWHKHAESEWIDWDDLVFYFLRNPRKNATSEVSKCAFAASYDYVTNGDPWTMRGIYDTKVSPNDFTYEEFLYFNDIEIPYLSRPGPDGSYVDKTKLRQQLILKRLAVPGPTEDSYVLKEGNSIRIPFNASLPLTSKPQNDPKPWFSIVANLEKDKWRDFIQKYQKDRDLMSQPENQLYAWKYVKAKAVGGDVEKEVDDRIKRYHKLKSDLEGHYKRSPK